jgi:parvulin-like peptidyl-prolyl isomerase
MKKSSQELLDQIDELPDVDPNQVTLEDAIQDTIDETEKLVNKSKETNDAIVDLLGPHTQTPEETIKEAAEWSAKNEDGEEIELDQEDQDTLNDALDSMVNEDGQTLREAFDKELEDEDDDTFEL